MLLNIIKISCLIFISKIIGFIRDIIIANKFGINFKTDAFYTVFKISNMLRRIFAEGAFSYVFIPILSKYKEKKTKKKIIELISSIYFVLFFILIIITILGINFSKNIIYIISPGFFKNNLKLKTIDKLLKITFPYIILISLTSYISSILNIWDMFLIPNFSPIILNIIIILYILFINKYFKSTIFSLAWSIIIGGIIQLLIQKISIKNIYLNIKFNILNIHNKNIYKIIKNIIPIIFEISIYQTSQIINNNICSYFKSGSISWIYYADKLLELPVSILGNTTSTILLPKLSKNFHNKNKKKCNKIINKYLKITLLFSIPISIILIYLSKILIITLFKYGKFNFIDVIMTSKILITYSIGLLPLIIIRILTPCFYSMNNNNILNNIAIFTLIITQILNIFTIKIFKHSGLSLSISLSYYINIFILYLQLKKKKIINFKYKWRKIFFKIILSSITMILILNYITKKLTINFINLNIISRLIKLLIIFTISTLTYICILLNF